MSERPKKADLSRDIERISNIPSVANILDVACETTGMGFAAIGRVTSDSWIACSTIDKIGFGLSTGDELPLESTICNEIMHHHQIVAIDHVDEDPLYKDHHTPRLYGLQSYISVPIILKSGEFFGTLCAIDRHPYKVNNSKVINTFKLFTELIAFHLDSQQQLEETRRTLKTEQHNAQTREQFIAMLGHDLRNPVNAISNAVQLQLRGNLDERNRQLATIISDATSRTRGLIDNIMDFASGRLGGGIKLNLNNERTIEETVEQVVAELHIAWPDTQIIQSIDLRSTLLADYKRIAQLLSNLLANAISHGDKGKPIFLTVGESHGNKRITVSNSGTQIPSNILPHLFKPFSRGKIKPGQEGLGLGLFIAREIVVAHHGTISVESDQHNTSFIIILP